MWTLENSISRHEIVIFREDSFLGQKKRKAASFLGESALSGTTREIDRSSVAILGFWSFPSKLAVWRAKNSRLCSIKKKITPARLALENPADSRRGNLEATRTSNNTRTSLCSKAFKTVDQDATQPFAQSRRHLASPANLHTIVTHQDAIVFFVYITAIIPSPKSPTISPFGLIPAGVAKDAAPPSLITSLSRERG